MRLNVVLRYVGMVLLFVAAFMLASAVIALYNGRDSSFHPLLLSTLLTALLGAFPLLFVEKSDQITTKEGYCIVVGAWLVSCVVGMFPYLIWGGEFNLINAWFESVSGFTATGASILNDIEGLPRGILFWRISSSWIGGIGVVMFALVILPSMGRNKLTLSSVELSALAKDNYRYRTQIIVRILLVVYVGLTLLTTLLLHIAGMNWFDALMHGMSASATCGFSTKNTSIAYFNSPMIETIMICTMIVAGIHFGLIFATVTGKRNNLFRSEVTRIYLIIIAIVTLVIGISLRVEDVYPSLVTSMRHSLFQTVALITTSGFATADSSVWTPLAIVLLMFCSFMCGCAGSTSGGLKVDRVLLAFKVIRNKIKQQQHPAAVLRVRVDGVMQENSTLEAVMTFTVIYIALIFIGTLFSALCGVDLMTSFSSSLASMSNVGPAFGEVVSMSNFSRLPVAVKFSNTLLMLFGRLEIFGLIQLFFIKWWR